MTSKLRNPAPPKLIAELETCCGGITITKPMRRGTAIRLLRMARTECPDGAVEQAAWRRLEEEFRGQLLKYTA